jgi:hypothetical protein
MLLFGINELAAQRSGNINNRIVSNATICTDARTGPLQ